MGTILAHVVDEFRQERDGESRLNLVVPASTVGSHLDADAFAILMRNLVENALKHGASEGPVDIVLSEDGVVRVVNGGPVVPPEIMARLKGRFERGDATGTGAGLGLAIAETIAAGAGAALDLASPAPGRSDGFEAALRLPR